MVAVLSFGDSKSASTPSLFSFSRLVHSVPSALSILLSPTGCSWSAYRLSVTPPDNANWCQTCASRPLCLTPTPHFLISLIIHLTSTSPLPFRLRPQPPHNISFDFSLLQCLGHLPPTTLHGLRRLNRRLSPAIAGLLPRSDTVLFLQGRTSLIKLALVCSSLPFSEMPFPRAKNILSRLLFHSFSITFFIAFLRST